MSGQFNQLLALDAFLQVIGQPNKSSLKALLENSLAVHSAYQWGDPSSFSLKLSISFSLDSILTGKIVSCGEYSL